MIGASALFLLDNGESHEDHAIYFVESDLTAGPEGDFSKLLPPGWSLVFVVHTDAVHWVAPMRTMTPGYMIALGSWDVWSDDVKSEMLEHDESPHESIRALADFNRDRALAVWIRNESSMVLRAELPAEDDAWLIRLQQMHAPPDRYTPNRVREELEKRGQVPEPSWTSTRIIAPAGAVSWDRAWIIGPYLLG